MGRFLLNAGIATVLAGCGAAQPTIAPAPAQLATPAIINGAGSWIRPEASRAGVLLYISDDATKNVFVYDFKTGSLVGKLKGIRRPYGECVDARGDIWISDLTAGALFKFPHGSISWTRRLDTQGSAVGCSVDPTTGNVAAANVTTESGAGDIRVFGPSGYADYSNDACYYLEQPGYDNDGNLYVEAYSASYDVNVCEIPHGGSSLIPVSVSQKIYGPGSVMWDGKYITLTDEFYDDSHSTAIYEVVAQTSGTLATVGTTVLTDTCDGDSAQVWQPFVVGKRNTPANAELGSSVVGFDTECAERHRSSIWSYPAGGNPSRTLAVQPRMPVGNAVSIGR